MEVRRVSLGVRAGHEFQMVGGQGAAEGKRPIHRLSLIRHRSDRGTGLLIEQQAGRVVNGQRSSGRVPREGQPVRTCIKTPGRIGRVKGEHVGAVLSGGVMMRENVNGSRGRLHGGWRRRLKRRRVSTNGDVDQRRRHPFHQPRGGVFHAVLEERRVLEDIRKRLVSWLEVGVDRNGGWKPCRRGDVLHGVGRTVLQAEVGAAGFNGGKSEPQQTGGAFGGRSKVVDGRGQKPIVGGGVHVVLVFRKVLNAPGAKPVVARIARCVNQRIVGEGERGVVQADGQRGVGVPGVGERVVAVGFVVGGTAPTGCFVSPVDDDLVVEDGGGVGGEFVRSVRELRPRIGDRVVGFG